LNIRFANPFVLLTASLAVALLVLPFTSQASQPVLEMAEYIYQTHTQPGAVIETHDSEIFLDRSTLFT
jgi:hypothetical protein